MLAPHADLQIALVAYHDPRECRHVAHLTFGVEAIIFMVFCPVIVLAFLNRSRLDRSHTDTDRSWRNHVTVSLG